MSLVDSSLDSLPYIDPAPTDAERAAALSLITSELPPSHLTTLHPRLPVLPAPKLTPILSTLLPPNSVTPPSKLAAIDTARYQLSALEPPTSDPSDPEHMNHWRETIKRAYTVHTYLAARAQHLSLLEAYGKNAWLIGNAQLEDELRRVERCLAQVKEKTEEVNRARREGQESVRGEIEGLGEAWRDGVRRLLGVMVATAELEEKRRMA